jgi:hypothetical protein
LKIDCKGLAFWYTTANCFSVEMVRVPFLFGMVFLADADWPVISSD